MKREPLKLFSNDGENQVWHTVYEGTVGRTELIRSLDQKVPTLMVYGHGQEFLFGVPFTEQNKTALAKWERGE